MKIHKPYTIAFLNYLPVGVFLAISILYTNQAASEIAEVPAKYFWKHTQSGNLWVRSYADAAKEATDKATFDFNGRINPDEDPVCFDMEMMITLFEDTNPGGGQLFIYL